jgi:hypothetical protein
MKINPLLDVKTVASYQLALSAARLSELSHPGKAAS